MNKNQKKFWLNVALYSGFGIVIGVSVWSIVHSIRKLNNKNNVEHTSFDWSNIPPKFKEFSEKNALKISLQASNKYNSPNGSKTFITSNGTAWSWYYEEISRNKYDWYLMTNFHVVNQAIAYSTGLTSEVSHNNKKISYNVPALLNHYKTSSETLIRRGDYFSLSQYKNNRYLNIISTENDISNSIESIKIITDFNNPSLTLFSNQESASMPNHYNLDMALIKISFDFNLSNIVPNNYSLANVYENYNFLNNKSELLVSNNKKTYIAGNPGRFDKLVAAYLDKQVWKKEQVNINKRMSDEEKILKNLYAPYYFSSKYYSDFKLVQGSSGASVYQFNNNEVDIWNSVPMGIYWGGRYAGEEEFSPSFIPFVADKLYNIYENFKIFLNNKV